VEPSGQPPVIVAVDEHEEGKLVERIRPPRLLLASLRERRSAHVRDRYVVGDEPGMFDLVARPVEELPIAFAL
jgi:hypothetical protein